MSLYESCIKRHNHYQRRPRKNDLSKNPNFSPAIAPVLEEFPDAKFIYLIRNPMEAVPSQISLKEREGQMLGSPLRKYACADFIIKSSEGWYNYPLQRLKELPESQAIVIQFVDLVQNAEKAILGIYRQFGFAMTKEYKSVLQQEAKQAGNHQSHNLYDLTEMGINKQEMVDRFGSIMEEYHFSLEL